MTIEDFSKQIERLRSVYGAKTYEKERVAVFFRELKSTLEQDFEQAVTSLIANSRQAPMLNELKEAVALARHSKPLRIVRDDKASSCRRCGGDGYLRIQNEKGYDILHRCSCEAGFNKPGRLVFGDGAEREVPVGGT